MNDLATRLSDEADQCRNDGADDIARLLDEAAAALRQPGPALVAAARQALTGTRPVPLNQTDIARIWRRIYGEPRADSLYFEFADAVMRATMDALAAPAEPVAWMDPATLDVIHGERKQAWIENYGMGGKTKAATYTVPLYAYPAAPAAQAWQPIETAPKDGTPILGWCVHEADPYFLEDGKRLTLYGAHTEGLSHVEDGPHVIVWGGAFDDRTGEDQSGGWLPDWWFRHGSEFEETANPTHWMPLPAAPAGISQGGE